MRRAPAGNVWSAIRSKGLEFNRVVLYGFGSTMEAIGLQRKTPEELEEDAGKRLPLEYFFNQLYVGASRAKHALFVVDSR
jgi:superfamily I DNA/RNA helicase